VCVEEYEWVLLVFRTGVEVHVHIVRISSKVDDVVLHPLKSGALILDAIETRGAKISLVLQFGQREETEGA